MARRRAERAPSDTLSSQMAIRFIPPLREAENRAQVIVNGFKLTKSFVAAMIQAEEEADAAGFKISWVKQLAREAHGIARRTRGRR